MGNMVLIMLRIKSLSQNPCCRLEASCKHYSEKLLVDSKDSSFSSIAVMQNISVFTLYFSDVCVYVYKCVKTHI